MSEVKINNELQAKIDAIEAQLERLDATDSPSNSSGIVIPESEQLMLPKGWVYLTDGTGNAYGPADEILSALESVEEEVCESGWELTWDALAAFADEAPDQHNWPEDLTGYESLEEGTPNDNPCVLLWIETNSGRKWTAGPDGSNCSAFVDAMHYDAWNNSVKDALAALEEWKQSIEE